jgi:hypothetical protein
MAKPYVEIIVGDDVKYLRFDLNAIADIEDHFDAGIMEIMSERRIGFSTLRALYWAGLKWKEKGLTIDRAGGIVQAMIQEGQDFKSLMEPVSKAIQLSGLFKPKKKEVIENGEGESQDEDEETP